MASMGLGDGAGSSPVHYKAIRDDNYYICSANKIRRYEYAQVLEWKKNGGKKQKQSSHGIVVPIFIAPAAQLSMTQILITYTLPIMIIN